MSTSGSGMSVFRRARAQDREGILAVSSRHPDDWIPYVIDQGLSAELGGFFVAEEGGRIVACCAASVAGDEAWLGAMRVHPEFGGRGLATGLTAHILEACRSWGCRVARLSTAVTNAPARSVVERKLGFRTVGRWVWREVTLAQVLELGPLSGLLRAHGRREGGVRKARQADTERVLSFIRDRAAAGLLAPGGLVVDPDDPWELWTLTAARLERYSIPPRTVLVQEDGQGRTRGVALLRSTAPDEGYAGSEPALVLTLLEGGPGPTLELLAAALECGLKAGATRLLLALPGSEHDALTALLGTDRPRAEWVLDTVICQKDLGGDIAGQAREGV
ncbi:MAG: GNAT family N-acetyltransferase [Firmicutes bacterium]|nr:GNAT family N-acetyltransferase [Bacillota bacterium]